MLCDSEANDDVGGGYLLIILPYKESYLFELGTGG